MLLPGEHIGKETPVPIPNTAVKLSEPMIVPKRVKVGIAGISFNEKASHPKSDSPFFVVYVL